MMFATLFGKKPKKSASVAEAPVAEAEALVATCAAALNTVQMVRVDVAQSRAKAEARSRAAHAAYDAACLANPSVLPNRGIDAAAETVRRMDAELAAVVAEERDVLENIARATRAHTEAVEALEAAKKAARIAELTSLTSPAALILEAEPLARRFCELWSALEATASEMDDLVTRGAEAAAERAALGAPTVAPTGTVLAMAVAREILRRHPGHAFHTITPDHGFGRTAPMAPSVRAWLDRAGPARAWGLHRPEGKALLRAEVIDAACQAPTMSDAATWLREGRSSAAAEADRQAERDRIAAREESERREREERRAARAADELTAKAKRARREAELEYEREEQDRRARARGSSVLR